MSEVKQHVRKSTTFVTVVVLLVMVSASVSRVMATPAHPSMMMNGGQIATIDLSKELPSGVGPSNVRLAIFDGINWFEIAFYPQVISSGTPSAVGNSTASSTSQGQGTLTLVATFRVPQPIGLGTSDANWWKIASDLGLNMRFSLVLHDNSNGQVTTIYAYYRTTGYAPSPNYPFMSYLMAKGSTNSTSTASNTPTTNGLFTMSSISPIDSNPSPQSTTLGD